MSNGTCKPACSSEVGGNPPRTLPGLLAAGWLAFGAGFAPPAAADAVTDWHALMLDAIRTDNSGPTLSTRNLAMLGLALYDAVNAYMPTHQPYLVHAVPPPGTRADVAAAAAGHLILTQLYPSFRARADVLFAGAMAGVPAGPAREEALLFGTDVGMEILEYRRADGANTTVPYIPSSAPGEWRRTPPLFRPPLTPHWRYVTPFAVPDPVRFRPPPPPALDSPEYAEAFNEVKALGAWDSAIRTAEQTEIAVFWSDFSYTAMPPGHFHEIAISISHNEGLSLAANARLFGLLGMAQADAAIICWETKYHYNLWRPVTAIQRADEDENPDTEADPAWEARLAAPPFPEYTSGHSTFSMAAATLLGWFLGRDEVHFTAQSDSLPGVYRSFTSLRDCAREIGRSRIYGGIHYQFANREGSRCGEAVADYVAQHYLLPVSDLPRLVCERAEVGKLRLILHGRPGFRYALEAAATVGAWTPLGEGDARSGGLIFAIDLPSGPAMQLFRAVELGPGNGGF